MGEKAPTTSDISQLLTIIFTTSITPSAPSTELLSSILSSFEKHCPALLKCNTITVFDNYDQIKPKARLKKGHITPDQAAAFAEYKSNVKKLILAPHFSADADIDFTEETEEAEYGSIGIADNSVSYTTTQTSDKKVTFLEPTRRLGFGLAVRSALRRASTPYVWIQQHDWALVADFPIEAVLQILTASEHTPNAISDTDADTDNEVDNPPIKYICLPAIRMLSYATSADVTSFTIPKTQTSFLKRDFSPPSHPEIKIPLTPLFLWHDKPHIASREHYLARVFPSRLSVLRGDFIEDKIGQRASAQMKDGEVG